MPQYIKKYNKKSLSLPPTGGSDQFPLEDRVASLPAGQTLGHYTDGENIPFSTCTTLQEVLDLLAISTLYPSFTNPSVVSLTLAGTNYGANVEVGTTIPNLLATTTFSSGTISPQYTAANAFRSGPATSYAYTGLISFTGPSNLSPLTSIVVISGTNQVNVAVSYSIGTQPKDSATNDYDIPYPAGTLPIVSSSFQGKYKVWHGPSLVDQTSGTTGVSSGARTLSSFFVTSGLFSLNPGLTATDFYVYVPVSSGLSITNAVVTTTFQNVTTEYVLVTSTFEIPDATGTAMILYKKYKMHIAIPYTDSALRHNITLG